MKLTPHEKTILELISKHPDIVNNPSARKTNSQAVWVYRKNS